MRTENWGALIDTESAARTLSFTVFIHYGVTDDVPSAIKHLQSCFIRYMTAVISNRLPQDSFFCSARHGRMNCGS